MKRECLRVEEAIWDHIKRGTELSEETRTHIARCADCARALQEAPETCDGLRAAACAPPAPDCRPAITSLTADRRRWIAPAWAYACALLLIAAFIGVLLLSHPAKQPSVPAADRAADASKTAPQDRIKTTLAPQTENEQPIAASQTSTEPESSVRETRKATPTPKRLPRNQHRVRNREVATVKKPPVDSTPPEKEPAQIPQPHQPLPEPVDERPVALIMVSFPVGAQQDTQSYSYTERDTESGRVTKCSATRSGDSVEIHMETTPGGENPPVKGSLNHESAADA